MYYTVKICKRNITPLKVMRFIPCATAAVVSLYGGSEVFSVRLPEQHRGQTTADSLQINTTRGTEEVQIGAHVCFVSVSKRVRSKDFAYMIVWLIIIHRLNPGRGARSSCSVFLRRGHTRYFCSCVCVGGDLLLTFCPRLTSQTKQI